MTTPYDELAYPSATFRQTHPDQLATHAALFGLPYAPVETCRVLDIGCGDGVNLIAMAVVYPRAHFVGLDLSEAAIARGQEIVTALGLTNVQLAARDLTGADYGRGAFDYVVSHGLYSWIPAPARDALLASVHHHLAPNGVAFVSHNALPGARSRQMVREMLLFRMRGIEGPSARLQAARAELERMLESFTDQTPLHAQINWECRHMFAREPGAFAHDELSDVFDPVYLHQFLSHAARHGLQYLTEARSIRSGEGFLPPYAIDDPTFDVPAHAQELDFQSLRAYRENLLVHAGVTLDRRPAPERILGLYAGSGADEVEPGVFDTGDRRFKLDDDRLCAIGRRLIAIWPQAVPVSDLVDAEGAAALLRLYWVGFLQLYSTAPPFAASAGDRPKVSALARLQAARGQARLSTPKHTRVTITDDAGLRFIASLDGSRTIDQIVAETAAASGVAAPVVGQQLAIKLAELERLALFI